MNRRRFIAAALASLPCWRFAAAESATEALPLPVETYANVYHEFLFLTGDTPPRPIVRALQDATNRRDGEWVVDGFEFSQRRVGESTYERLYRIELKHIGAGPSGHRRIDLAGLIEWLASQAIRCTSGVVR